ncbi:MAG: helicase-related protein [Anditalea sp.]
MLVDRQVREYVEYFAKNNKRQNFCISCTSTLELGIDIGSVDEVAQIDATHSIASLIQRVGRSGRTDGRQSNLFLYATDKWSLLQSLACWLLYKDGFIEPPQVDEKPYDILVHQAISITKGHSGIQILDLVTQLKQNTAFKKIELNEIQEIISHLIEIDLLERLRQEVIIGIEGEKVVNSRHFYTMFQSEEQFKVVHAGNNIGEVPFSPQFTENENIFLAARIWKIKFVDEQSKRVEVLPAHDGKKPIFFGGGGKIHPKIREKMLEILYSKMSYDTQSIPHSYRNSPPLRSTLHSDSAVQAVRMLSYCVLFFLMSRFKESLEVNSHSVRVKCSVLIKFHSVTNADKAFLSNDSIHSGTGKLSTSHNV